MLTREVVRWIDRQSRGGKELSTLNIHQDLHARHLFGRFLTTLLCLPIRIRHNACYCATPLFYLPLWGVGRLLSTQSVKLLVTPASSPPLSLNVHVKYLTLLNTSYHVMLKYVNSLNTQYLCITLTGCVSNLKGRIEVNCPITPLYRLLPRITTLPSRP